MSMSMSMEQPLLLVTPTSSSEQVSLCCPSPLSCFLSTLLFPSWTCCDCPPSGPCGPVDFSGCRVLQPREEVVVLYWGVYEGVLRTPGCFCTNPFGRGLTSISTALQSTDIAPTKVVDARGSPLVVSAVVTYQVVDSHAAVLDIVDYRAFLASQAEVVLKQTCALHTYQQLTGEASAVRAQAVRLLQAKLLVAGLHVAAFEFKQLSYAPEVAGPMLIKQQAAAMLEARSLLVEGGVRVAYDAVCHLRAAGLPVSDVEAGKLAGNLLLTICSESRVTPTMTLSSAV